jgi:hypothetical protein
MKKYFTIPVAILILLAGMQFTIATHICGGEIASTHISISGKTATCGMVQDSESETSSETILTLNCCENEVVVYTVEDNYTSSNYQNKDFTQNIDHSVYIPVVFGFNAKNSPSLNNINVSPPDAFAVSSVNMTDICIFRI